MLKKKVIFSAIALILCLINLTSCNTKQHPTNLKFITTNNNQQIPINKIEFKHNSLGTTLIYQNKSLLLIPNTEKETVINVLNKFSNQYKLTTIPLNQIQKIVDAYKKQQQENQNLAYGVVITFIGIVIFCGFPVLLLEVSPNPFA